MQQSLWCMRNKFIEPGSVACVMMSRSTRCIKLFWGSTGWITHGRLERVIVVRLMGGLMASMILRCSPSIHYYILWRSLSVSMILRGSASIHYYIFRSSCPSIHHYTPVSSTCRTPCRWSSCRWSCCYSLPILCRWSCCYPLSILWSCCYPLSILCRGRSSSSSRGSSSSSSRGNRNVHRHWRL